MARHPISDAELFRIGMEVTLQDVHVCLPARIVNYANQRADVQPLVRKPIRDFENGVVYDELPVIPNVPVQFPRGKAGGLHIPLEAGDVVVLVWSDQSYSEWRQTGVLSSPFDQRRHGYAYPIAFPSIADDNHPYGTLGSGYNLGIDDDTAQVSFTAGSITVGAGAVNPAAQAPAVLTLETAAAALQAAIAVWVNLANAKVVAIPAAPTGPEITTLNNAAGAVSTAAGALVTAMGVAAVPGTGIPATVAKVL